MTKVAKLVDKAAPNDWKDTLTRTVKTAVAAGISSILAANIFNVQSWRAAAMALLTTGVTFALNAALVWANS